jgi:hypothetical protein
LYSNSIKDVNQLTPLPSLDITPEQKENEKTMEPESKEQDEQSSDENQATENPNERTAINTARKSGRERKAPNFFKPDQKVIDC